MLFARPVGVTLRVKSISVHQTTATNEVLKVAEISPDKMLSLSLLLEPVLLHSWYIILSVSVTYPARLVRGNVRSALVHRAEVDDPGTDFITTTCRARRQRRVDGPECLSTSR